MKEPDVKEVDVFIESELGDHPTEKGKKTIVKSLLKFPCATSKHAALRIFDAAGSQVFYASPRNGNMEAAKDSLIVDVTNQEKIINGCKYSIVEGTTKKVLLSGQIKLKDAAASKVVSLKTGTNE